MKRKGPLKAIRAFCLECCGTPKEVSLCTGNLSDIEKAHKNGDENDYQACPLYEFRFGKNPARKGLGGHGNPEWHKKTLIQDKGNTAENKVANKIAPHSRNTGIYRVL